MKNLWKYLSTLGLMLVACLCLGVGLKASDVSFGAMGPGVENHDIVTTDEKACVYIANGKHEMSGGTLSGKDYGVYIAGGTFTMNGGTIKNAGADCVYINGGTFNLNGGSITNSGNCGIFLFRGTFNYTAADDVDSIGLATGQYITLKKAPTHTLYIENSTIVGTKIAKLDGFTSLTATQLSYLHTDLESNTRLEVQYIDGAYWVVIAEKTYKLTITSNIVGGANFTDYGGNHTRYETAVLMVKKGARVSVNSYQPFIEVSDIISGDTSMVSSGFARYNYFVESSKFQADGGFYVNNTTALSQGSSYTINSDTTIIYRVKQIKCTITFTATSVLGNPAHYSTTSSTTAYNSASSNYTIDVDTNSTIQVYQNKVIVGSTTVYVIFKSGQVYSSVSITGLLGTPPLFNSTSYITVTITQDVTVIYQGKASSFLAQGEEGEAPPEIQWGIEVVMRDEDKIMTKPTLYIMPSDSEIIVRRRVK